MTVSPRDADVIRDKACDEPVYECLTPTCRTITFLARWGGPLCPSCHEAGSEQKGLRRELRRARHREANRAYRERHRERLLEVERAKKRGKPTKRNPEREKARHALNNAVRDGKIVKPSACDSCGASGGSIHGHHGDYSQPLTVEWLCSLCHGLRHRSGAA